MHPSVHTRGGHCQRYVTSPVIRLHPTESEYYVKVLRRGDLRVIGNQKESSGNYAFLGHN